MKLIVITTPQFFEGEAAAIISLFRAGLEILHLRKPEASVEEVEYLLHQLPKEYMQRIVIHEHFQLASSYNLKGIHLNRRNPYVPAGYTGHISCSCHSLDEVAKRKATCDYLFLSPIYDSISKEGYSSAYSFQELQEAHRSGIIDAQVMALGGICREHFPEIVSLGFGGAVLLGDVWNQPATSVSSHFQELLSQASSNSIHPLSMRPPIVLSIAGSDCSGGAGIQADIKTISALGGYAASVITAVTAQNTVGVQAVFPLPTDLIHTQIESVMNDLQPDALKIGMVHNAANVHVIAECLQKYRPTLVVYDPVMISTSGHRLMADETIQAIKKELFPLCTLITPNLEEARLLYESPIHTVADMQQVAKELSQQYHTSFLIKGGHLEGGEMCDVFYSPSFFEEQTACTLYNGLRIKSHNLHGTGCTLSSAIATFLARGNRPDEAIRQAKAYISEAIRLGKDLQIGHGNGPLWHYTSVKALLEK